VGPASCPTSPFFFRTLCIPLRTDVVTSASSYLSAFSFPLPSKSRRIDVYTPLSEVHTPSASFHSPPSALLFVFQLVTTFRCLYFGVHAPFPQNPLWRHFQSSSLYFCCPAPRGLLSARNSFQYVSPELQTRQSERRSCRPFPRKRLSWVSPSANLAGPSPQLLSLSP